MSEASGVSAQLPVLAQFKPIRYPRSRINDI
jgi:hypothetical protein